MIYDDILNSEGLYYKKFTPYATKWKERFMLDEEKGIKTLKNHNSHRFFDLLYKNDYLKTNINRRKYITLDDLGYFID